MEYLANLFAAWPLARRRPRRSQIQDDQERTAVSAPLFSSREKGLSAYIPSPLVPIDQRVRALAIGGAPAWSRRLKKIHDLRDVAAAELEADWHRLAERRQRDPARFAAEWRQHAERFDWTTINDLIDRHNRHFPAEVNLPMDVHTRDYVAYNGTDYRLRPLDTAWILERFPADLAMALR